MTISRFNGRYQYLSNFYASYIMYHGEVYPSVEHAFQAAKTIDRQARARIRAAATCMEAKHLGRSVERRPEWEQLKYGIMYELVHEKFQDENFARALHSTGRQRLVEGNQWHDNIWGDCLCANCISTNGKNWLGRILMEVRSEL